MGILLPRGKRGTKGKKETSTETVKVTPTTKKELTKTKGLMEFYLERDVSYDEVIGALLEQAPKSMISMLTPEELEKVQRAKASSAT